MIRPGRPAPTISRAADWPTLKQPVRLMSSCACHCAWVTSRNGAESTMPGVTDGDVERVDRREHRVDRRPVGHVGLPVRRDAAGGGRCEAVRRRRSALTRSISVTAAPRAASSLAIAPPMSPAAPVTAMPSPSRSRRGCACQVAVSGCRGAGDPAPSRAGPPARRVLEDAARWDSSSAVSSRSCADWPAFVSQRLLAGAAREDQDDHADDDPAQRDPERIVDEALRDAAGARPRWSCTRPTGARASVASGMTKCRNQLNSLRRSR